MAAIQSDFLLHISSLSSSHEIQKKKFSGRVKKEELEKKVSMLQKVLNEEKNVHEILELVNNHGDCSSVTIPSYVSPKIRKVLAELAMVEGEIARLESQISQLQSSLKLEQDLTKASRISKQWRQSAINSSQISASPVPERVSFESKGLHFINKAIQGDYNPNDFKLLREFSNYKGQNDQVMLHEEAKANQDHKVSRKSGVFFKPSASPLREPRHPSPKTRERMNPGIALDHLPKSPPTPTQLDKDNQNLQPNRLSENILKCLNFIYVRLLRTSRTMELEKSGPVSRTLHSSLSSRSFRVETGLNPSTLLQKESKQQDPYGIFNEEQSIPRDIGPYKNLVIFTSSSMDIKSISSPSYIPLLKKLRVLMNNLQNVDLISMSYQQKLAFWINMYNACIMHGFLEYGVPSSPEKLLSLMNKATLNIGGNIINAQAIEDYILRKPRDSNMKEGCYNSEMENKEAIFRELYGLKSNDPNVTYALCYGTRSSPAVRIYTAEGVVSELEKSKLEYLQASIVVTSSKSIAIPELVVQNMHDFAGSDIHSLMEWICQQLPSSGSLRKSMMECLRGNNNNKISLPIIEIIHYDFEFQYLLAI